MDNRSDDNLKLKKFKTVTKFKTVKSYGGQNSRLYIREVMKIYSSGIKTYFQYTYFQYQIVFHLSSFD